MISSTSFHVFRPFDSTIIDHLSWRAIETTPDRLLTGYLDTLQPSVSGLVLRGLELVGEWAWRTSGTRRPDSRLRRPYTGSAVVSDKEGKRHLDIDESRVQWPSSNVLPYAARTIPGEPPRWMADVVAHSTCAPKSDLLT